MNFDQHVLQCPADFAFDKLMHAAGVIRDQGLRAGIPNAWVEALMFLKRDIHIPKNASEAFAHLSNEMGGFLEAAPGGGLRFMAGCVDEERLRGIECSYRVIFGAIMAAWNAHYSQPQYANPWADLVFGALSEQINVDVLTEWQPQTKAN